MSDNSLPSELRALEDALVQRTRQHPSPELRERVLDEVRLAVQTQTRTNTRRGDAWQFAAAVAGAVLLWMNLSMSATQATDFGFRRSLSNGAGESVEAIARQIQEIAPELTPAEARRQAVLMQCGASFL